MRNYIIILLIPGGLGAIQVMIAALIAAVQKRKIKVCASQTTGTVVEYYYNSAYKLPMPVVEYNVDGEIYRKRRRYHGVVTTTRQNIFNINPNDVSCYISENDVIHIKRGTLLGTKGVAEQLYPLGAQWPVFYNPDNPKQVIWEHIPTKAPLATIFLLAGGFLYIAVGVWLYFRLLSLPH